MANTDIKIIEKLNDGVLLITSKNNFIVNKKWLEIFNVENFQEDILNVLNKNKILPLSISDGVIDKTIEYNNKKVNIYWEKDIWFESYKTIFLIFKDIDSDHDNKSEIEELKKSINAMKDILDNAYQGIVLVNEEAKIIKWNYEKLFGIKEEDVLGKDIEDVIENTRLHLVLKTGQKELYDIQRIQGHDMIASRTPIIKDGKVIGAVGTVLFKDVKEVKDLANKIRTLENTVDIYKNEIGKIYHANYTLDNIITQNKRMIELKQIAKKAAHSSSTILIEGDSGTGKEYFAHAIHHESNRRNFPFVRINCAAIPHELLESELFGYEAGSFTGAKKEGKIGKFELANGGTILLDEIGSMPLTMQSKLLRVLEEREIEKVGARQAIKIDIRVIASTNEKLSNLVEKGLFRQDLYYRLNVVEINIPPLKDRLDDIDLLCDSILNEQLEGFSSKVVSEKAKLALKMYDWPGNVRELRNVLERAANMSIDYIISTMHLPDYISNKLIIKEQEKENKQLKQKIKEAEIDAIMTAIKVSNGSRTRAAKMLGIHRTAIYKKLAVYGIDVKKIL